MTTPSPESIPLEVPWIGETILSSVCRPDTPEKTLSCLQELFRRRAAKRGVRAIQQWYYWQIARVAAALGLRAVARIVLLRVLLSKLRLSREVYGSPARLYNGRTPRPPHFGPRV